MEKKLKEVEVRPAYEFTCEECGRDNFIRSIRLDESILSAEQIADLRADFDVPPGEEAYFTMDPKTVTCQFCGGEFNATPCD